MDSQPGTISERYAAGETLRSIASALGLDKSVARRVVLRAGVPMRPRGCPAGPQMPCAVADCWSEARGEHGLCNLHRQRMRRHGDPSHERWPSLRERVEARIDRSGDCWVWTGVRSGGGYGQVWSRRGMLLVHRYVYEQLAGPIPQGLVLDHLCRNPSCCNPAHLEPVTTAENVRRGLNGVLRGSK